MVAEIASRMSTKARTPLQEVIPLSTPFLLFVDPSSLCNFRCKFCPTGDSESMAASNRLPSIMSLDLFKKIIDDLSEFDQPLKTLRLYKDGEPFLNHRLADMVRYAKEIGHVQWVDTTTNGWFLRPSQVQPVVEAGIDEIWISVNGMSDEQFWDFSRQRVNFKAYVEDIRHLYENRGSTTILIKAVAEVLSTDDLERFMDTFGPITDKICIEHVVNCWPGFEAAEKLGVEITQGTYGQPIDEDIDVCPYIFYSMSVNADGRASLCFLDWGHEIIWGDLREQSLKQIWDSDLLRDHQLWMLEEGHRDIYFCKDCHQLSHGQADNIGPWRLELAQRLRGVK